MRYPASYPWHGICRQQLYRLDRRSEGEQRQFYKFKTLQPKRNPYDRTAEQKSVCQRRKCQRDPAEDHPENIGNKGQCASAIPHFLAERKKGQTGKFKALQSNGNTDDRNAP